MHKKYKHKLHLKEVLLIYDQQNKVFLKENMLIYFVYDYVSFCTFLKFDFSSAEDQNLWNLFHMESF